MKPTLHTYKGEQLTVPQIARRAGLNSQLIHDRLARGWDIERAANTPAMSAAQASRHSRKKSPWGKSPMVIKR